MTEPLLAIEGLRTSFRTPDGAVNAVDGVSWTLAKGEILGIVGESGCGKSMTALSIMGLVPSPPGQVEGSVRLGGRELVGLPEKEMRSVRGNDISMVFQEPMTSLDPVMRVVKQIAEPLILHQGLSRKAAHARAVELLDHVRIPEPERRAQRLSASALGRHAPAGHDRDGARLPAGGADRRRADDSARRHHPGPDPELLLDLRREFGTSIVMITHDLGVIAETADRVIVMYAGRKVEEAPVARIFAQPHHPYTVGLLGSVPRIDRTGTVPHQRLAEIEGAVPVLDQVIVGCRFAPRCLLASDRCRQEDPPLEAKQSGHFAACWHSDRALEATRG